MLPALNNWLAAAERIAEPHCESMFGSIKSMTKAGASTILVAAKWSGPRNLENDYGGCEFYSQIESKNP